MKEMIIVIILFTTLMFVNLCRSSEVDTKPKISELDSTFPAECNVTFPCWIGDGWCDDASPGYNTPECGYDGGDCCEDTCIASIDTHEFSCGTNGYVCKSFALQPTNQPTGCGQYTNSPRNMSPKPQPTRFPILSRSSSPSVSAPSTESSTTDSVSTETEQPTSNAVSNKPSATMSRTASPSLPSANVPFRLTFSPSILQSAAPIKKPSPAAMSEQPSAISARTSPPTVHTITLPTTTTTDCPIQRSLQPTNPESTPAPTVKPPVLPPTTPVPPSRHSTVAPSTERTSAPTSTATEAPGTERTSAPTSTATEAPSTERTSAPTSTATETPSTERTSAPTSTATEAPSTERTSAPTSTATETPSTERTSAPTSTATEAPSTERTSAPTSTATEAPSSERTSAPTSTATEAPITERTSTPTSRPSLGPTTRRIIELSLRPTGLDTGRPISIAPISSATPTERPISESEMPTSQSTTRITGRPITPLTTLPTSTPSLAGTLPPSAAPPLVSVTVQFGVLMFNTTLPESSADWSRNEITAIERGVEGVLQRLAFQCVPRLDEVSSTGLLLPVRRPDARRLLESINQLIIWDLTLDINFDSSLSALPDRRLEVLNTLNSSLYSGELQQSVRASSREQQPVAGNLFVAVLCTSRNDERCQLPGTESLATTQLSCDRNTEAWDQLYNVPATFPWYSAWLFALCVIWLLLTVWAIALVVKRLYLAATSYALINWGVICSALRLAYLVLLLLLYWRDAWMDSTSLESVACTEFAYLDKYLTEDFSEWTFYAIELLVLFRDLFYPCLLILGCYWMQRQVRYLQGRLDLLNRPNTPGFVRRFFAHTNFCVGAASVLLAILLTKSIVTLARPAWTNNYGWLHYISQAVQFISGFLLFLIALAFVPSMRSLHNLITTYMQEDSVRQVAEEDVLSELEAEGLAADEALSTRRQRGARLLHSDLIRSDHALFLDEENPPVQQRQQRGAAGGPHGLHNVADAGGTAGEHTLQPSSPSATVFEAILLCVANALLVCVTAISVVLRTPFIALLLYSLGARLVEILLVSVILRSIARESRLLPGTSSPPIMSPTSAQPLTGFTTKNVVPMQSALATTAGDVPSAAGTSYPNPSFDDSAGDSVHMEHAPPPLQRGVVHIASRENISPALTTRSSGLGPPPSSAPARYHPPPSSPAVAAGASRGAGRNGTDDRAPGAAVRAYNKRWPWIFTPSNDIPSRKVETDAPKRVKVKSFSAPASYDKCRNDSPDDDSTDSGLQYFK